MIDIRLHPKLPYNLDATLDCGQAFRWEKISSDRWLGVLKYGVFEVKYIDEKIIIEGKLSERYDLTGSGLKKYLADYFNIDFDPNEFEKNIFNKTSKKSNELIKEILNFSKGLRVLNQDPFETAISYLFSIQSNIPLIKRRVKGLSQLFTANKVMYKNNDYYIFPNIKELSELSIEQIKLLKLGFREKYFIKFIEEINNDFFTMIEEKGIEEKRKELKNFYGIGDKVASCILLFGMKEYSEIPFDVWINRFFDKYFANDKEKFYNIYYPYGGILQEYIYRWMREKK